MFDVEITFTAKRRGAVEKLIKAVWVYACALYRNGQIADDYSLSRRRDTIRLLCLVPEKCALELRFHDARGKKGLRSINELMARQPVKRVTGEAVETPSVCRCRRRSSIHLFTHMFDDSSPLACGVCHQPIPFYRLRQLDLSTRESLLRWQDDYQACDQLFMHSGFGEMWGYGQMSRLQSGLTKDGRQLCAELEAKLGVPVFYYLHRYWGRNEASERRRRCPGCKGTWLLPKSQGCFDFRCGKCRLLSCLATDCSSPARPPR